MNRLNYLKLFFLATIYCVIFTACEPDDPLDDGFTEFRYDAANVDAPFLPAGSYESGVRFAADFAGNDDGNNLTDVDYFIKDLPASASMKIYNGGTVSPSSILYEALLTNEISSGWNTHVLSEALRLDGSDLWINIEYEQSEDGRVLGCDGGPANANGDWLYDTADGQWSPLSDRTNQDININWNIRGQVELTQ